VEQEDHDKKRGGGKHFTWDERIRLETLVRTLYPGGRAPNLADLAGRLGRHRSSVSREYRRGKTMNLDSELEEFPVYSARKAQDAADRAALNKGPRPRLTTGVAALIRDLILLERLSPYAAVMTLRKRGGLPRVPCERTVYYAIDAGLLGVSRAQLPYRPEGKRREKAGTRMAYTNPGGRPVTERPPGAEDRSEYGHWEMDTVVGGTGTSPACLLVMVERMTRQVVVRKIPARTQAAVARELDRLERSGHILFSGLRTVTCDNGCEFLDFNAIERSALCAARRCEVFFAHPFRASERGSNENANRIVRRFIPKGADISAFTRKQIQRIEDWINALPRKILDGLSAEEKVKRYFEENVA
jgi:IS30 family transposase